jgi:hypothetical protein
VVYTLAHNDNNGWHLMLDLLKRITLIVTLIDKSLQIHFLMLKILLQFSI